LYAVVTGLVPAVSEGETEVTLMVVTVPAFVPAGIVEDILSVTAVLTLLTEEAVTAVVVLVSADEVTAAVVSLCTGTEVSDEIILLFPLKLSGETFLS
jgi:hypothetical protein